MNIVTTERVSQLSLYSKTIFEKYFNPFLLSDLSVPNLKYLTVKQALADVAHFIRNLKNDSYSENSPIILSGSFYSASLVVWFKRIYPELMAGGWAISGANAAKPNLEGSS